MVLLVPLGLMVLQEKMVPLAWLVKRVSQEHQVPQVQRALQVWSVLLVHRESLANPAQMASLD